MNPLTQGKTRRLFSIFFIALLVILASGRLGFLSGKIPNDLGINDGRLKPPSMTPNSISSQAFLFPDHPQKAYAAFAAWQLATSDIKADTFRHTVEEASNLPGAHLILFSPSYAHFEMRTPVLGFVDDFELWLDSSSNTIHIRSASRLGQYDFGKNRERAEMLARQLTLSRARH